MYEVTINIKNQVIKIFKNNVYFHRFNAFLISIVMIGIQF